MPGIDQISIREIKGIKINSLIEQAIEDEFRRQLADAALRYGNPAFSRKVDIVIEPSGAKFDSEKSILVLEAWRVTDPKHLKGGLAHEIVHLIVGNKHGESWAPKALVMEEGVATYNATHYADYRPVNNPKCENALNVMESAKKEVHCLFDIWRQPSGDAPVIQTLHDSDLEGWGLSKNLRDKLLADF
jgi:hypothetical protein